MGTRDNAGDQVLGSGDDPGDRKAEDWRRRWWLSGWGVQTTLETLWLGSGDDTGDLLVAED